MEHRALSIAPPAASLDPMKSMKPAERLALADSSYSTTGWSPGVAARSLSRDTVTALIDQHDVALRPVHPEWLDRRLRLLWKSSTPSHNLNATAWLHETVRLLADLPQDIVGEAIDECVMASERGFMPTVGEIRKRANPRMAERRRNAARLGAVRAAHDGSAESTRLEPKPWDRAFREPEQRCTPAEAAEIIAAAGLGRDTDPTAPADVGRERGFRKPSRADYIRLFGIDPGEDDELVEAAA